MTVSTKRVTSIAQLRTLKDRILTECYVVGIGFSGLTAMAEHPVERQSVVFVDLAYVNENGAVEGETVKARVVGSEPRAGSHLLSLAFLKDLRADPGSRLAQYIRRELGLGRQKGPAPPLRAKEAGSA
jgi:hypothetical protein